MGVFSKRGVKAKARSEFGICRPSRAPNSKLLHHGGATYVVYAMLFELRGGIYVV